MPTQDHIILALGQTVNDLTNQWIGARARIAELEAKIAELEAKPVTAKDD